MILIADYAPIVQDGKPSQSKMVIATPIEKGKMAKLNTFNGEDADLMYGMLVGLDENGELKDVEKEKENL